MMSWMSGKVEEKNRVSSYRGYLLKLRRSQNLLAPQWGSRWFSVEGRYLKWYRTENDISPSGMVNLKFVRNISKVDSQGHYTFCVSCPERNLVLRCTNYQELNNWMKALHIQADKARGGSGTHVVSDFNEESAIRNPAASQRNSKLRSSLTLEQEFDLNLKKLDALEKAVHTPDVKQQQQPSIRSPEEADEPLARKYSKPYNTRNTPIYKKSSDDYDDFNVSEVLGKLRNATSDGRRIPRNDSTSSIEEVGGSNRNGRWESGNLQSSGSSAALGPSSSHNNKDSDRNRRNSNSRQYEESQQRRHRRERRGIDSEDDESDEFDSNSDRESSPKQKRSQAAQRRGSGGRASNHQQSSHSNAGASRLSSMSIDSVDSDTFHYIPESRNDSGSNQRSSSNNGGGYDSGRSGGNRRSAW